MGNRWRFRLAAAALVWPALLTIPHLIAPALAQSPDVCTECASKQKELIAKQAEVKKLETDLQAAVDNLLNFNRKDKTATAAERELSKLNEARKQLESEIRLAQAAVEKLKNALATCLSEPCNDVGPTLSDVIEGEAKVAQIRYRIFELKLWLAEHSPEQNTAFYKNAVDKTEADLKYWEAFRATAQRKLDELIAKLATTTPWIKSVLGTPEKVPKADCADCEGPVLKLEADLAKLRFERLNRAREIAKIDALTDKLSGTKAKTRAEQQIENEPIQAAIKDAQSRLQQHEKSIAESEQAVANDRVALAACKCPPKTATQPDVGTPPGTPGVTPPNATQPPPADPTKPVAPRTPAKTPSPGGQDTPTPPPSGNAPPPGPPTPKGGVSLPPSPVAGAPAPARTTNDGSFVWDDDEDTEEEYFTFAVPIGTDLKTLLAAPFFKDKEPWVIPGEQGRNSVTIWGGETPTLTSLFLSDLQKRGVINSLDSYSDVCWHFRQASDPIAPAPGAWVLYTPPSPTPTFNPGERPGDDGPPAVARVGRDGTYNIPLAQPNGTVEVRIAKGCSERTTAVTAPVSGRKTP